ncbi:hypothetical protein F2Q70_00030668 [Brassica cretica]|uniref:histidine kinase n=1 Tax=Brassica cretica TaxID=69181 RepID=A0A8S9FGR6_BRACR|nr:hypothetical protein F2Q70_00030668 [Brassica cretica]
MRRQKRESRLLTGLYLGGVFDIETLVENLLQQLASKQTILVNVYDTTNHSQPISMYGSDVSADVLEHVSPLNFGDPFRKHEMRCRFKQKPPWPVQSMVTSFGILVIALLVAHIFHATLSRIRRAEEDCHKMELLKKKAEAADVAKSQFLATVSHEIRTPMNGVLGMLHMLMDTELDVTQQDYVRTAQASGKALVSLINEVLDQAKIESGKVELEEVRFDLRGILDDVLSLFSGKSQEKGLELAVYISDRVPEMLIGDPGRFRQILTNLMGNSIKFTEKGHIFVTVHLVEELLDSSDVETSENTLSGLPVADRQRSWQNFKAFSSNGHRGLAPAPSEINLIVSVEDTGVGIPVEAQSRIFTPFMQVGPSISRTHGGTGIGLSISKCLVGLMKGEIGFSSTPKVGSTFTFTAVFANGVHSTERKSELHNNNQPEFEGMKALLVDHRPARAQVSWYHFQRLGIRVELVPSVKYSQEPDNSTKSCKARGADLRVHFKNTRETAHAIRKLPLIKAKRYLEDVIAHKQAIPFTRFCRGVGRTAQAKNRHSNGQGRWPAKSAQFVLDLLKNAESNAEVKGLDVDALFISHIQVNQAAKQRRRTYRAHGRINPYMSNPCHIELILSEKEEPVKKEMLRSSKAGFRARPRFTLRLRLCDDKSAFVLPVYDFNLIRTDIKSANCHRLIRLVLIRIELPPKAVWRC